MIKKLSKFYQTSLNKLLIIMKSSYGFNLIIKYGLISLFTLNWSILIFSNFSLGFFDSMKNN